MENKVSGHVSPDNHNTINSALQSIHDQLPFLVELDPTEAKRLTRMEAGRYDFVRRALLIAKANPMLAPQFFEIGEMEKDMELTKEMDAILVPVDRLRKQVSDTRDQAGHEAYVAAREIYNTCKRATVQGIPGAKVAYEELKQMFEGQGRYTKEPEAPKQP
ncbi:MAG: hypothetical protein V4590_03675 [Bacteroidota bacterium]